MHGPLSINMQSCTSCAHHKYNIVWRTGTARSSTIPLSPPFPSPFLQSCSSSTQMQTFWYRLILLQDSSVLLDEEGGNVTGAGIKGAGGRP